jgi:hypothetical protein
MSKVTLTVLKKYLRQRSQDELISDIVDLFTRLDAVKDFYTLRLDGPGEDLIAKYKATIQHEFFPARGFGQARLAVARKAIADFRKLAPPPASLADLMLFYVEMGVRFTNTYGDINESFYRSMETVYEQAAKLIASSDLEELFAERCQQIVHDTRNIGWGFHDTLTEIYDEYFESGGSMREYAGLDNGESQGSGST